MLDIINPSQTVLVTCRGKANLFGKEISKDNMIAIDWHTPLSFRPMMYAVSIAKQRFSYDLIHDNQVLVVNFMPFELNKEVLFCGRNSGRTVDKFDKTGLTSEEATKIDCCRIKEACAYLECEVIEEKETGDHVLFICKVLFSQRKTDSNRVFHVEGDEFTTTK
jgi:flavin reductase (DIM6/NTAB) family NADH-FMN oxidoreductase RutF